MKKRGFTLIELMVVVALIAGISVVAIVSLTGIADKRKEEEWENTKSLIETAAKNYYNANEYMFEGNGSKDLAEAYVTVGKLVDEGYLNKVTNPMTNQAVGYCNQVKITVDEGKAGFKYEDKEKAYGEDCDYAATNDELEIRSSKNISATVVYKKETGGTATPTKKGWFNIDRLGEGRSLKLCIKTKSKMSKVTIDKEEDPITENKLSGGGYEYCHNDLYGNGKYTNKEIYIEDSTGEYWKKYILFNVDTVKPKCKVNFSKNTLGDNGWHTSPVTVSVEQTNEFESGVDSQGVSTSNSGPFKKTGKQDTDTTGTKWHGQIISVAENTGTCYDDVKLDSKDPTCQIVFSGTSGNAGWYRSNVTVTVKATSNPISGVVSGSNQVSSSAGGTYKASDTQGETPSATWYGTYKNGAGRSAACRSTVKVDSTKPTISGVKLESSTTSYNSNVAKGYFTIEDTISGIGIVKSNKPNTYGNSQWDKNGDKKWVINGYGTKLSNSLDGSTHSLTIEAYDVAGNYNSSTSSPYTISKKTTPSCYTGLTYDGTKKNGWYRTNVKVKKGSTTLCTISSEGMDQTCSYTIAETETTSARSCTSGKVNIDKTAPSFESFNDYATKCTSFEVISSNTVDHRARIDLKDGSSSSKSSGIDWAGYNYKYSKHKKNSCDGTWCTSTKDASNDNMLKFARPNAALMQRTAENQYYKVRFDFNFLEDDTATLTVMGCDRAGNCTSNITKNVSNTSGYGSTTGYCRKVYSVKKGSPNQCGSNDVNCYLVPDKK